MEFMHLLISILHDAMRLSYGHTCVCVCVCLCGFLRRFRSDLTRSLGPNSRSLLNPLVHVMPKVKICQFSIGEAYAYFVYIEAGLS